MILQKYPKVRDWIRIYTDRIELRTGKVDIGQRISTALMRIAIEELDVPVELIRFAEVRTGSSPDEGITAGSRSVSQSGHAMRAAAATLRSHVLDLASSWFGTDPTQLELSNGIVSHRRSNRKLAITELAGKIDSELEVDASTRSASRNLELPWIEPVGLNEMITGEYMFVQDLDVPGMLHARVVRPPRHQARLESIDADIESQLESENIRIIRDGSFLAVAGGCEWRVAASAMRLFDSCRWDHGKDYEAEDIFELLMSKPASSHLVVDGVPNEEKIPSELTLPDFERLYERPYQLHGSLAPSAALAEWNGQRLTVTTHSQGIYPLRESIAESLNLPASAVEVVHAPGSGCYGHNGADDAAFEAALISILLPKTPILLKWTRRDEHRFEPYSPAMAVKVAANLEEGGSVSAYSAEAFSDTHSTRPVPGPNQQGPSRFLASGLRSDPVLPRPPRPNMGEHAGIHRNLDPSYQFGTKRLVKNLVFDLPMRTSAMRCLGGAANDFARECFVDEVAVATGRDPLGFRRQHLAGDQRSIAVIDRLSRLAASAEIRGSGRGRGFAFSRYKNSSARVGIMVDLFVDDFAAVKLASANIVVDAGRAVDPDGIASQLEGGFMQAASWALYEEVYWNGEEILSSDWDTYPVIRFDNVPEINSVILDIPDAPSLGVGEAAPGPALAAIVNAICNATGIRMRRLPITPAAIREQAISE
ncbi:MAG: molybdopterin-dependent oxidoreductase [Albidovulum sp.]|nr:molybdopterin-dependent oxidoreductase [Albidovulum sp.]